MVLPSHLIRHYSFCPPMRITKLVGLKSTAKVHKKFEIFYTGRIKRSRPPQLLCLQIPCSWHIFRKLRAIIQIPHFYGQTTDCGRP